MTALLNNDERTCVDETVSSFVVVWWLLHCHVHFFILARNDTGEYRICLQVTAY